jgi:RNA polymerase sigma factor (sigma-70 family)
MTKEYVLKVIETIAGVSWGNTFKHIEYIPFLQSFNVFKENTFNSKKTLYSRSSNLGKRILKPRIKNKINFNHCEIEPISLPSSGFSSMRRGHIVNTIDSETIEAAKSRDNRAIKIIYQRYWSMMLNICGYTLKTMTNAEAEVEDIAQNAWVKVIKHIDQFRGNSECELRAWIIKIAKRESSRELKSLRRWNFSKTLSIIKSKISLGQKSFEKKDAKTSKEQQNSSLNSYIFVNEKQLNNSLDNELGVAVSTINSCQSKSVENKFNFDAIIHHAHKLPNDNLKRVLYFVDIEHMTYKEAAKEIGCTHHNVKKLIEEAREFIRMELGLPIKIAKEQNSNENE